MSARSHLDALLRAGPWLGILRLHRIGGSVDRDPDDIFPPETRDLDAHEVFAGRYKFIRELGRGAMGTVHLAQDEMLNGLEVAIKRPAAVMTANVRAMHALKEEAVIAHRLAHPHIVTLRSFEVGPDGAFLVMDYIDGCTLEERLGEVRTLSEEELRSVFQPLAAALDYAHEEGVLHRDLKPSNVMIRKDGRPFLADFGIARELKDSFTRLTGHPTSGTLPYMSPEQLRGRPPAPAQDVYGLAATLYECLAGHPPFHRGEIAFQIVMETPEPPTAQETPLTRSIMRGLAKEPGERPRSCKELVGIGMSELGVLPDVAIEVEANASDEFAKASKQLFMSEPEPGLPAPSQIAATSQALPKLEVAEEPPAAPEDSVLIPAPRWAGVSEEQLKEASEYGVPASFENSFGMRFVLVPSGTFWMGSPGGGEERQHPVKLTRPYYMQVTAVTNADYKRCDSSHRYLPTFDGDEQPVVRVSWKDARGYAGWLSRQDPDRSYNLPTEAQWERACRAGTMSPFSFGDEISTDQANFNGNFITEEGEHAVFRECTTKVGEFPPSAWGLYDMHGNVWEWCRDWYGPYETHDVKDPVGAAAGTHRVLRGGSWFNEPALVRSATRTKAEPGGRYGSCGFRLVASLPAKT